MEKFQVALTHKDNLGAILALETLEDLEGEYEELGFQTPLCSVARRNMTPVVTFLLEKSVDINVRDTGGRTPLHHTAYMGHIESAEALIQGGADLSRPTYTGVTPLQAAFNKMNIPMVSCLLNAGADVNARHHGLEDWTLLGYLCMWSDNLEMIEIFLKAGADVNLGAGGRTAARIVREKNKTDMIELFDKYSV